jgi:hypothetical protein
MSKSTQVTKPAAGGAVVTGELANMFAQDAGAGLENVTAKDLQVPFIGLLQGLSPQIKRSNEKYIPGAEQGMFFNTVTQELFQRAEVIPIEFTKVFNEWIPRKAGSGFVATHKTEEEAEANKRQDPVGYDKENDNAPIYTEVHDTANHFVMIRAINEDGTYGEWGWAILSMTKTKLKVSRSWLSRLSNLKVDIGKPEKVVPPSFATIWQLTSVEQKNDKGEFYNYKLDFLRLVDDAATYEEAKKVRELVVSGVAKVDYNKSDLGTELNETKDDDRF